MDLYLWKDFSLLVEGLQLYVMSNDGGKDNNGDYTIIEVLMVEDR